MASAVSKLSRMHWLVVAVAPWLVFNALAALKIIPADVHRWLVFPLIAWVMVFGLISFARLDEVGREAHKTAFFWGSGAGLFVATMILVVFLVVPNGGVGDLAQGAVDTYRSVMAERSEAWREAPLGFFLGMFLTVWLQGVLGLIAWLVWWARKR